MVKRVIPIWEEKEKTNYAVDMQTSSKKEKLSTAKNVEHGMKKTPRAKSAGGGFIEPIIKKLIYRNQILV